MNTYLAIITTVLVITQIIRVIQNRIQLHRQNVLFQKQLGQIEDVTQEDLDRQRKAYRLIVEYLENKKIKPPIAREVTRHIEQIYAEVTLPDIAESHNPGALERKLKERLGEEVYRFATVQKTSDPLNYEVRGKAILSVLDKAVTFDGR